MKLEIYDPGKVGEVTLNPYEWTYDGMHSEVHRYLDGKPRLYRAIASEPENDGENVESEVLIEDEETYLRHLARDIKIRGPYDCVIIND